MAEAEEAAEEETEEAAAEDYYVPPEEMDEIEERLDADVCPIVSGYVASYMHRSRYLKTEFGIRREDDGMVMIGNSPLSVDEDSSIIIHGETLKGTARLWELLTRKIVD